MIKYVIAGKYKQTLLDNEQLKMSVSLIACSIENHFQMPIEYICMHPHCLRNSQQLACIYCCQQLHKPHLQNIQALKILLTSFKKGIKPSQFNAAQILLNGVSRCRNEKQLKQNIGELVSYNFGGEKFENIIDRNNQMQKDETRLFYEQRNCKEQLSKTVKKAKQPLQFDTPFIIPILTFSPQDAAEQDYELKSPFCVVNTTQKLVTAFAYPALNRFEGSVQISIKVERITPFWLGLGLSFGKKKYQPQSKQHILMTSNGWVSILGKQTKTAVKYCLKDTVKIKLDKKLQILQFVANSERHSIPVDLKWNQDVFLCCVLFYKNDSIQILA